MLTVETFKERLERPNHSDSLYVAVDANNENQFYIVGNGGMGTTISASIGSNLSEIKECVISMINSGELIKDENKSLLLDRNILIYYLQPNFTMEDLCENISQ